MRWLLLKPTGKKVWLLAYAPDISIVTEDALEDCYWVPNETLQPHPEEAVMFTDWQPWTPPNHVIKGKSPTREE